MPTILTEYYADELTDWNRLIAFYSSEKDEMEHRLAEVIQRNTIPNIAAKVEAEQNKLTNILSKFYHINLVVQQQLKKLKTDSTFIDDSKINAGIEKVQNELRHAMQQAEKEYVDVKYDCTAFILRTLKR